MIHRRYASTNRCPYTPVVQKPEHPSAKNVVVTRTEGPKACADLKHDFLIVLPPVLDRQQA